MSKHFIDENGVYHRKCSGCGEVFNRFGEVSGEFGNDDMRQSRCYDCRNDVGKKIILDTELIEGLTEQEISVLTCDQLDWTASSWYKTIAASADLSKETTVDVIISLEEKGLMKTSVEKIITQHMDNRGVIRENLESFRARPTKDGERVARILKS